MNRVLTLSLSLLAAGPPLAADAVDDFLKAHVARHKIPGLALAVCRDGQGLRAAGYGLANVEHDVPVKPETVFQSGSVGKQFTAMAVMMLVEEGKLRLDETLAERFPGAPAAWKKVTVRHLLTHTSGIRDWEGKSDIDYRKDYTEDELVRLAMKAPFEFPPGTAWSYSNTGYVLLGALVRKASGTFYGDFLSERVFVPLGMDATRVISEADIVKNRAAGYTLVDGRLRNQEWVSPTVNTTADGSLYVTALDLAKWDAALWAGRFLKPESYREMWTPVRLADGTTYPYGFGWGLDDQRGERVVEHGGSWQGFRAAIVRYPERRLSVIVLANLAQAEPERVATAVAGLLEPGLAWPDPQAKAADPDPSRTAALRDALMAWARGEASPRLAKALRATAVTPRTRSGRNALRKELEKATGFVFLARDDVRGRGLERRGETVDAIVYALLQGERPRRYRIHVNAKGEVVDHSAEHVD